jgi:hypothetical protein
MRYSKLSRMALKKRTSDEERRKLLCICEILSPTWLRSILRINSLFIDCGYNRKRKEGF